MSDGLSRIVKHCKASVTVSVNEHTTNYETIQGYFDLRESTGGAFDDEEKVMIADCIRAGCVWEIQAYPDTPIGFVWCAASSFEAAVELMLGLLGLKTC